MAKQKKPEEAPAGAPAWMATFSDLVTLLMCFFVLLYAMSNLDQGKFMALSQALSGNPAPSILSGASGESIMEMLGNGIIETPIVTKTAEEIKDEIDETSLEAQKEINQMADDFKTYLAENNLEDKVGIEVSDQSLKLTLLDNVLFDSGSAIVKPDAFPILQGIGESFEKYPSNDVKVEGHADNRPISTPQFPSNWELSSNRAINVAKFFIQNNELEPRRIEASGFGEQRPIDSNETEEGRAKNRRVEIKIISRFYSDAENNLTQ